MRPHSLIILSLFICTNVKSTQCSLFDLLFVLEFWKGEGELSQITLFRVGLFGGCSWTGGGGMQKDSSLLKICHTYPTMKKFGTVMLYLRKIQKYINQVTHSLISTDVSIYLLEISNFCYIKKYRYRLHFDK